MKSERLQKELEKGHREIVQAIVGVRVQWLQLVKQARNQSGGHLNVCTRVTRVMLPIVSPAVKLSNLLRPTNGGATAKKNGRPILWGRDHIVCK